MCFRVLADTHRRCSSLQASAEGEGKCIRQWTRNLVFVFIQEDFDNSNATQVALVHRIFTVCGCLMIKCGYITVLSGCCISAYSRTTSLRCKTDI